MLLSSWSIMHVLGNILVYNYNEQIKTVFLVYDSQARSMIKNFTKSWKRNVGEVQLSAFNQSGVMFSAQESTCPSQCRRHDLGREEINHYTEGCWKEFKGAHNPYNHSEKKHSIFSNGKSVDWRFYKRTWSIDLTAVIGFWSRERYYTKNFTNSNI